MLFKRSEVGENGFVVEKYPYVCLNTYSKGLICTVGRDYWQTAIRILYRNMLWTKHNRPLLQKGNIGEENKLKIEIENYRLEKSKYLLKCVKN